MRSRICHSMADQERIHQDTHTMKPDPSSWDQLPIGLFAFDTFGRIISYNDSFVDLLGVVPMTSSTFERCTTSTFDLYGAVARVLAGETVRLAGWYTPPNRQPRFVRTTMSPSFQADGRIDGGVGVIEDMTEQRRYEERMEHLSSLDPLTELFNRKKVGDVLTSAVQDTVDTKAPAAVIMLDIDYFKLVNDTFGHPTGDLVLRSIAQLLRRNIRKTDSIGRWGGEEFLIVAPQSTLTDGIQLADKLRQKINDEPFGPVPHVTCSFGVSSLDGGKTVEQALQDADEALYVAKNSGRNQVSSKR
ncbi:GGDEF domain-containing protein [Exiguobacterium sp. SH3S2]|nr:GGDEF domain-containing protein [Exiguobacterium sp. SH4S7]TCI45687.1 GGDEF domain-containing protein [Exiguobacterium sp. SH3S3]TCI60896.1 GGDEF domain-containing protein [Exiguobacterium sp. SH3S2]TCI69819.1 GGDEF domain-containing protein [Exiguobacterium sp. SH0S7]TCI80325.1 GGDEF domain-containing protein [Exiguobacterium sp. SH0S1]